MATYKTPDVYVEEISLFPPSVAEVETAIPAFIGYTETATKISEDDLRMKPTRIGSMLDYEKYFGLGPELTFSGTYVDENGDTQTRGVYIDDNNNFKKADLENPYFLYDSIRLYYNNGGGDCYIVSVGDYEDSISLGNDTTGLQGGLKALEKYDEPTLILFPDAVKLSGDNIYTLQKKALEQCNSLKDRFGVFDLLAGDEKGAAFRDKVGIQYLKYGSAYTPWLKVALDKDVNYGDIATNIYRSGSPTAISLKTLTSSSDIKAFIDKYDALLVDIATSETNQDTLFGAGTSFRLKFADLISDFEDTSDVTNMGAIIDLMYKVGNMVDDWANTFTNSDIKSVIAGYILSDLRGLYQTLIGYDLAAEDEITGYTAKSASYDETDFTHANWQLVPDATDSDNIFASGTVVIDPVFAATLNALADDAARRSKVVSTMQAFFETLNDVFLTITGAISKQEDTLESTLIDSFPLYKTIISGIDDSSTIMPPSGAVVGIYAATDRNRGVWKAPANVSLNSVLGPSHIFTASELDALNIDVNAGKSINAIRAFTGKGTLIWGARTLAGNDNEWRYISVRRFFNTVEESIKKSTYWAVFEPNSANTWVKVKGMIENYLTNKWREGALVGAKPDEAFFVKIGLGQTMTAEDILNGYMYVEIGMAVVRPAEFIVLKFSHKLQQS
ncbi:MAG: hypothetical protein FD123_858 [Bacteroidetes bacterium]|nr:MAG: hypothetical protein FD123_858 [Bacteroidota bacterium]